MRTQTAFSYMTAAALAAGLCLTAAAQTPAAAQNPAAAQTPAAAAPATAPSGQASSPAATSPAPAAAQNDAALTPPPRQGFWGRMDPFARKKYVNNQLQPIRDRVNELDELTNGNTKSIADVDARAKAGIADANDRATQANQTADAAQQQAQQDAAQAQQLNQQVGDTSAKLQGVDQFEVAQTAELQFGKGPAQLTPDTQQQLDTFLQGLDSQKGYVVEVTAYSNQKGAAAIANSQKLADTVVRYLVLQHNVPLYRIYTMGMGNAEPTAAQMNQTASAAPTAKTTVGGTVQIKILKNSLAAAQPANPAPGANPQL